MSSRAWAGWIAFAGTILLVVGAINILQGVVALVDDKRVVATPDKFVLVDVTSWGWTLVVFGVLLLAIGLGLLAGQAWARFTGIVVVGLHAVVQVASLGAYPVWSLMMVAFDVVVLFALTARWGEARTELRPEDDEAYMEQQVQQQTRPYQRRVS